jgi:hypothetical protein
MTVALIGALPASAVEKSDVTFSSQSVPGTNGTSFVYFQARGSGGAVSTVPTHRFIACPTRYYMRWTNVVVRPQGTTSYDVQIFDCNTGQPVNDGISRAGELSWQPGSHPILAGASSQLASGQVIYALDVSLSPPVVKPNQDSSLEASVADDFVAQADRTLNISVDPNGWSVASWSVDFGDGQTASLPRRRHQPPGAAPVRRARQHQAGRHRPCDRRRPGGGLRPANGQHVPAQRALYG